MKINIALIWLSVFMQSSCEVKQSLSTSHVQIGLPKNSAVWKASLLHIKWKCIPRVIVPLSGYYPPGPWWPHHSFQCLQMGKRGSVRGGKRSSLYFSRSGDFSPDQTTKNPSLCPTKPLITQQVNPKKNNGGFVREMWHSCQGYH